MAQTQPQREIRIVYQSNNFTYELDEAAVEQILLREDVKDLPVVVVSVAGTFRAGKSFLLNFFLRYLKAPEEARNENGDWLGTDTEPLTGFSWRGGSERNTTGILMWSEPFIMTLPSGDKVAVLLMDTQGTFDSSSTVRDCSTVFALSTLVSSVLIYNIKENIKESDLQHLQLFSEYGKLVMTEEGKKAFQVLQFLVRDWPYEYDHAYGLVGGEELLTKRLEVTAYMAAELRDVRQHIRSCFETLRCFLMPHPGNKVSKKNFTGQLSEMDPEFKTALKELVPSICSPANLTPKLINGERVKARDLLNYIRTYVRVFNSDTTPTPVSIMKATAEASLATAMQEARELYEARMERATAADQPSLQHVAIHNVHRDALAAAQAAFSDKKKLAPKNESDACLTRLTEELKKQLPKFLLINNAKVVKATMEAKAAYDASIQSVHGVALLCVHPTDLNKMHDTAEAAALAVFDANRQRLVGVQDDERMQLLEELQKKYDALRNLNERHNRLYLVDAKINFSLEVDGLLGRDPPLPFYQFQYKYEEAKERAVEKFMRNRNIHSSYAEDPYKDELKQDIRKRYDTLRSIYRSTTN